MEEDFIALLLADAGVAALAGDRVHWVRAPQGAQGDRLVLQVISGPRDHHMEGPSGLVSSRVQADCYAGRYLDAKALARAVEAAVSGYRGEGASRTFQGIFIDSERDLPVDDAGAVARLFRVSLDLIIWHG